MKLNVNAQAKLLLQIIRHIFSNKGSIMVLHTAKDILKWEEVSHHVLNRVNLNVTKILQAEIFYYKNEEISIRATLKLQELNNGDKPFGLNITSYAHVQPDVLRLEFTETKHIGDYETLEEAMSAAQIYYNRHHNSKYHHQH